MKSTRQKVQQGLVRSIVFSIIIAVVIASLVTKNTHTVIVIMGFLFTLLCVELDRRIRALEKLLESKALNKKTDEASRIAED